MPAATSPGSSARGRGDRRASGSIDGPARSSRTHWSGGAGGRCERWSSKDPSPEMFSWRAPRRATPPHEGRSARSPRALAGAPARAARGSWRVGRARALEAGADDRRSRVRPGAAPARVGADARAPPLLAPPVARVGAPGRRVPAPAPAPLAAELVGRGRFEDPSAVVRPVARDGAAPERPPVRVSRVARASGGRRTPDPGAARATRPARGASFATGRPLWGERSVLPAPGGLPLAVGVRAAPGLAEPRTGPLARARPASRGALGAPLPPLFRCGSRRGGRSGIERS